MFHPLPLAVCFGFALSTAEAQNFDSLRERMVTEQLIRSGIKSPRVLQAMRTVERQRFVPVSQIMNAYADGPLLIGGGQTISQPYVVAFMTESLDLQSDDKVLEIGTGSGYQAAILAQLCGQVHTIEILPQLGARADSVLHVLGYKNIVVHIGDGYKGWAAEAPYDAIVVTCSPSRIPEALAEQLKEGGRMIIPVGEDKVQDLVLITKVNGKLKKKNRLPVLFVPMHDRKGVRY